MDLTPSGTDPVPCVPDANYLMIGRGGTGNLIYLTAARACAMVFLYVCLR